MDTQDTTDSPGKRHAPSQNTTEPVPEQLKKRYAPSQNTKEPVPEQLKKRYAPSQNTKEPAPEQLEKRCAPSQNTTEPVIEQLGKRRAPSTVQFEPTIDNSDAGSLTTQAPQLNSVHATINALSAWISAVQPRESWYLVGWIEDSPIEFLVDPGAVVSALSLKCYENLIAAGSINTPLTELDLELEAANRSDMKIYGMCSFELIVHGLSITMDTVVVDLNCQAILGMDSLGDATKLPFILDLVEGTLSGGGYETIQLHRFHAATECFAETVDTISIPPHSEVILWAKLKTNNGRRGPTAGVVLALQTLVQEFGLLVGRSLVRADADDWKVSILLYNSDPCTRETKHCKCNPVTIPARTRIARVEEIQAIQNIGTRTTETNEGEEAQPLSWPNMSTHSPNTRIPNNWPD